MLLHPRRTVRWLSNAYLVFDEPGGKGVLVDSNTVTDPLAELAEREGIEITHLLLTHHHYDHVVGARELAERFGAPILAHELTDELIDEQGRRDVHRRRGDRERRAADRGHAHARATAPTTARSPFNDTDVLTADVLFKGTVGGTRAPGATGFEDLKTSVMDKLMKLPPETRVHPGHREPTTIGEEWESNPFIRIWRGLDEEGSEPCTIGPADAEEREQATLVLWAPDYDGGNKAWVRFADGTRRDRRRLAGQARRLTAAAARYRPGLLIGPGRPRERRNMQGIPSGARGLVALVVVFAALIVPQAAGAAITDVFGGAVDCTVESDGVRFCDQGSDPARSTVAGLGRGPDRRRRRVPARARVRAGRQLPAGDDVPRLRRRQDRPRRDAALGRPRLRDLLDDRPRLPRVVRLPASRRPRGAACDDGYIRLIDNRYEVRDAQEFAGQLADEGLIDPQRIGSIGGSYGGGMSMALGALATAW